MLLFSQPHRVCFVEQQSKVFPNSGALNVSGECMTSEIRGWKKLSKFTGLSKPVLVTSVKLRDFPKPEMNTKTGRQTWLWNTNDVNEWLKKRNHYGDD